MHGSNRTHLKKLEAIRNKRHRWLAVDVLKEIANDCPASQSAANRSAGNADGPQAECGARPRRRAQYSACRYVRTIPEDQELPLACVRPAFPGLPPAVGRARRSDF